VPDEYSLPTSFYFRLEFSGPGMAADNAFQEASGFRPDGEPLRAKVDLTFVSFVDAKAATLKADRQSSDLAHHHSVKAGDTLPLLCHRIYGDARYCLQVDRYNELTHFSQLVPGTLLAFPPLV